MLSPYTKRTLETNKALEPDYAAKEINTEI